MIDGRIHPGRIQEAAEAAASELAIVRREAVDHVLIELKLAPLPSALTDHLEALRFRTSYGQNLLAHSREVAEIAALVAAELGLDVKAARVAGLLHDVGKAAHSDDARPHAVIGAEWARQAGLGEDVAHAIEAHHHDVQPATALAHLIILADRISAARPGARRESLERLVQRIKELEELARSEPGVQDAFAVRAGRELRVLVRSQERDDAACQALAENLALRISEQGLSPFPVKVTVLRESQFRAESQ
jgi:ribonuclease Y